MIFKKINNKNRMKSIIWKKKSEYKRKFKIKICQWTNLYFKLNVKIKIIKIHLIMILFILNLVNHSD